jgi:hypothetical protein
MDDFEHAIRVWSNSRNFFRVIRMMIDEDFPEELRPNSELSKWCFGVYDLK